jgi:Adenosine deaminase
VRVTAHAGENGAPWKNVQTAIDILGVERVDHGYTVVDNVDLAKRCAGRGIVFTVVPTNSFYLRTLPDDRWAIDHPIRAMAKLGLRLHPNTDNPTLHKVTPTEAWLMMCAASCTMVSMPPGSMTGFGRNGGRSGRANSRYSAHSCERTRVTLAAERRCYTAPDRSGGHAGPCGRMSRHDREK